MAMLACLVALLIGLTVICAGLHRRYQANTIKNKRVLSFQFIGRRILQDPHITLVDQHLHDAIESSRKAFR